MSTIAVRVDTSVYRFGTRSLRCQTGNTGSNAVYQDAVNVVGGDPYVVSVYVKTNQPMTGGGIVVGLAQAGDTTFTPLAESDPITDTSDSLDDGWTRISAALTLPSGISSVLVYTRYTGSTADLVFWLDGIKHERGAVASTWQENLVSPAALHDQIGSVVDASHGGIFRLIGSNGGDRDTVDLYQSGLRLAGDTELASPSTGVVTINGATIATGSGIPSGSMVMWGAAAAPSGWLLCDGSAVSRTTYATLFAAISTTYGAGDGSTTFNVPNFVGRFPLGKAAAGTGNALGATGGTIDHTHTSAAHSHSHTHTSAAHSHSHTHTSAAHAHSHSHQTDYDSSGTAIGWQPQHWGAGSSFTLTRTNADSSASAASHYTLTDTDATSTTPGATGSDATSTTPGATGSDATSTTPGATGANNPPFLVVNFIIKT